MRESNTVTEITTVQFPSKFNPGQMSTIYNLQMINGDRIGAGFKPPPCKAGDAIEYDLVMKGQYKNAENIAVTGQGANVPATQPVAMAPADVAGAVPPASTFGAAAPVVATPAKPYAVDNRQCSIMYQSAYDKSLKFLDLMLQHDCIVLGTTKGKKADICKAWVDDYADTIYRQIEEVTLGGGIPDREEDFGSSAIEEE
jgi:hypothetical protein